MRLFIVVVLSAGLLMLLLGSAPAQETPEKADGLKPDLPLEKPVPEAPPEEPPEEEPTDPPGEEPPGEEPPEEPPQDPPPEFFDEPIEAGEVIFVIDRTSSMEWPSKMSVVDKDGKVYNNAAKIDVARIELVKALNDLSDSMKFAMVGFSTGRSTSYSIDANWSGRWTKWPPANGVPAPFGYHIQYVNDLPVWPATKSLVKATQPNKTSAIAWAQTYLTLSTIHGGTDTDAGMAEAMKMITPAPPGVGPGGEPKKSPTAIYLLTDGAPTGVGGKRNSFTGILNTSVWGDGTWQQYGLDLTKANIIAKNVHRAVIYTLGIGMDNSCANMYDWNPATMNWAYKGNVYCDKCRQFLTQLAEATGGHYREVSK